MYQWDNALNIMLFNNYNPLHRNNETFEPLDLLACNDQKGWGQQVHKLHANNLL